MNKEDIKFYISLLRKEAINDDKDRFVYIFEEFIKIMLEQDLSDKTLDYLFDIFIKDMKIYFKEVEFKNEK